VSAHWRVYLCQCAWVSLTRAVGPGRRRDCLVLLGRAAGVARCPEPSGPTVTPLRVWCTSLASPHSHTGKPTSGYSMAECIDTDLTPSYHQLRLEEECLGSDGRDWPGSGRR
jgi:hypothetical protein